MIVLNKSYQNLISGTARKGMPKYNIMSTDQENFQHYLRFVGRQTDTLRSGVGSKKSCHSYKIRQTWVLICILQFSKASLWAGHLISLNFTFLMEKIQKHKELLPYPRPRSWLVIPFSNRRHEDSSEKWLISRLAQGIYKMSLEYLAVHASKEMLQQIKQKGYVKGT